jgi:hypothetical protein
MTNVVRVFASPLAWQTVADDFHHVAEEQGSDALAHIGDGILADEHSHKRHLIDKAFETMAVQISLEIATLLNDRDARALKDAAGFFDHLLPCIERWSR